jgi:glycosyltransferase involved in cell wall biosynthesis
MLRHAMTPRRVLMTCDAVGGVWRYALDLAQGLTAAGTEVVLVGTGPRPGAESASEAPADLVWLDRDPVWIAGEAAALARLGGDLAELQRRHGADLVHVNQPAEAAGLVVDVPVVVGAHSCLGTWWRAVRGGPPPAEWLPRIALERDGLARAAAVLAPSASHAAALAELHGPAIGPVSVVANASPSALARTGKAPLVLAAARWWDPGKNLAVLDAAASACRWPVVLCGSTAGPDGTGVAPRHAEPLGHLPAAELRRLMARAALFVSPSLYEPFGLAALEAARAGAALLLADIPTYREVWAGAAHFFDPRSAAALARALDRLTADERARRRLAAAARARAAEFTPERQLAGVQAAYAAALASTQAPSLSVATG